MKKYLIALFALLTFVYPCFAVEQTEEEYTVEYAVNLAEKLMKEGLSAASAAKQAAEITGKRKNEIYRQLI